MLGCRWQRCTVHFLRDMFGHCGRQLQPMIVAAIRHIFRADDGNQARERLAEVVDRLRAPAPNVARLLEDAERTTYSASMRPPRNTGPSYNPLGRVK